jgi:hypothetical protein
VNIEASIHNEREVGDPLQKTALHSITEEQIHEEEDPFQKHRVRSIKQVDIVTNIP